MLPTASKQHDPLSVSMLKYIKIFSTATLKMFKISPSIYWCTNSVASTCYSQCSCPCIPSSHITIWLPLPAFGENKKNQAEYVVFGHIRIWKCHSIVNRAENMACKKSTVRIWPKYLQILFVTSSGAEIQPECFSHFVNPFSSKFISWKFSARSGQIHIVTCVMGTLLMGP